MLNIAHCWRLCKIPELTEVMKQRGDQKIIYLLNNFRIGKMRENNEMVLNPKFIHYPNDANHAWAENTLVAEHNKKMLA